jgi:hypothetical protein
MKARVQPLSLLIALNGDLQTSATCSDRCLSQAIRDGGKGLLTT